jgi:hypothetical protein
MVVLAERRARVSWAQRSKAAAVIRGEGEDALATHGLGSCEDWQLGN